MMLRFRHIVFLACFICSAGLHAQQLQQFTQYQWVGTSFNPAFAGTDAYFNVVGIHRTQWTGINDAPRTYLMGVDAPSKSGKMGFGGTLITDVAGPTKRFGLQGLYSYHLQVNESSKISLGAAFGLSQFTIDGSQISLREQGDRALDGSMQSELKPDAAFGALWYSDKFKLGISATQILNNQLNLFPGDGEGNMTVHYYLTGSYLFDISELFDVEPSTLVKYVKPAPAQIDLSARVIYKKTVWLGSTWRSNDAFAAFAGYRILDYLAIGYSYDFTTSAVSSYTDGTHEIFIQLRFGKKQMLEPQDEIPKP